VKLDAITRIEIEHDCTALCHAFGYYLDKRDYEAVASLFTDDGVWKRYGVDVRGREALLGVLNQRSSKMLTRHLVGNILFTEVGDDICRAVMSSLSFFNNDATEGPAVLPPDSTVIMDFHDTYRRSAAGWRFYERDLHPIMVPEAMLAQVAGAR
jgi:hypothetical protein